MPAEKYVYSVTMTTTSYRQQFSTSLEGIRHILTLGIRREKKHPCYSCKAMIQRTGEESKVDGSIKEFYCEKI